MYAIHSYSCTEKTLQWSEINFGEDITNNQTEKSERKRLRKSGSLCFWSSKTHETNLVIILSPFIVHFPYR